MPLKRKTLILLFVPLICLMVGSCTNAPLPFSVEASPTPTFDESEEKIIAKVLSDLFPESEAFLVFDKTWTGGLLKSLPDHFFLAGLKTDTYDNFLERNQSQDPFKDSLKVEREIILTNRAELEKYRIGGPQVKTALDLDWAEIRDTYPEVTFLMKFTKVGFDRTYQQAYLEIAYYDVNEGICVEYYAILLTRSLEEWEIAEQLRDSICT